MLVLALDTCDARGSLAILRDEEPLQVLAHDAGEDYSSWVLPAVHRALQASSLKIQDVELYSVATGPGSFTGLRVGLTSVKAWSEVYRARIAGVSRLEAIASQAAGQEPFVASFFDAQREQVFGGLFRRDGDALRAVGQELVGAPEVFLNSVSEAAGSAKVAWVSLDPEKISSCAAWQERASRGESIQSSIMLLAPLLAKLGLQRAREGRLLDALSLDAQYVRRSDAEIFWKGHAAR